MNVIALQGSPRRGGNTDIVLNAVLEGLQEKAGADVTVIRAADKRVSGCLEDFACQTVADAPGCSIDDDMNEIYGVLLAADLVILASPVFCWGVTAQLKAILDRLYACFKFNESPPRCLLAGKSLALVLTAGGRHADGANLCESMYDNLITLGQGVDRGRLICPLMKGPRQTKTDSELLAQARRFGASLL